MVISKQHFHPMCFIAMSAPLRLGCNRHGRGFTEKDIGDPWLFRSGLYAQRRGIMFRNLDRLYSYFRLTG